MLSFLLAVLECGTSGVLAVLGDHGYPYAVPISYVYDGAHIYFHCAKVGHKLDAVKRNQKASFCVIDKDEVIPEEYTSYFRILLFLRSTAHRLILTLLTKLSQ